MTHSRSPADTGLFDPDSVTWRVHADPILIIAGLRALLLQALHPLAMAGVDQHSGYRSDPWGRLRRTGEYVGAVSFGTTEQAHTAIAKVRRIHSAVSGVEPETGKAYRADDPGLLLWVHCCEVDSFLSTTVRSGLSLSDAEADAYVAEQVRLAVLIGIPEEDVPTTADELSVYFGQIQSTLTTTSAAKAAARFLVVPPMPTWVRVFTPAVPAWGGLAGLAFALLPGWARRAYGIPVLPLSDVTASLALRLLRRSLLALPRSAREGPSVKAARERLHSLGMDDPFEKPAQPRRSVARRATASSRTTSRLQKANRTSDRPTSTSS